MLVKAKVAHMEPPTGTYRSEGEEFDHDGPLYKHVDAVKKSKVAKTGPEEE